MNPTPTGNLASELSPRQAGKWFLMGFGLAGLLLFSTLPALWLLDKGAHACWGLGHNLTPFVVSMWTALEETVPTGGTLGILALEGQLRNNPMDHPPRRRFASLLARLGRFVEAEGLLLGGLKLSPFSTDYFLDLAKLAERRGDPENALEWLKRGLEEKKDDYQLLEMYFFLCYYLHLNWEGSAVGEHLLKMAALFDRDEMEIITFLHETMRQKFNSNY